MRALEELFTDIRHALSVLGRSPAFTLVALVTLMLGIGANVAVFGVLNAVLLRPLEVSDPHNLYQLRPKAWTSFKLITTSYPAFEDFRRRNLTFSDMAAFNGYARARLGWGDAVRGVSGYAVTGNYFDMLGVQPEVGRFFQATDADGPNAVPCVVLSHSLWQRAFGADRAVVGATVRLDKDPFTVVGVAPAEFHGTEQFVWPDYWIPIVSLGEEQLHTRASLSVTVLGRLKPGVTPQQATDDLNAVATQLAKEYPATDSGLPLRLVRAGLFADNGDVIRGFLRGVTGLALLVLVAACANLASLFAARAADRSRELALRAALGASQWRLMRQLMTEALLLSMLGGAEGLVIASLVLSGLNQWQSPYGHVAVGVDARVCLAALTFAVVSALLFGMIPARQVWQSSPLPAMKGGAAEQLPLHRFALRDLLLGAQIAICMLLVMASLVAVRGMVGMLHAPLGFEPKGVMLAEMDLSLVEPRGAEPLEKKKAMIEAVRNIPGVVAAGMVNRVPFTGGLRGVPVFQPGTTELTLDHSVSAPYVFAMSPGYLEAAGTRLRRGRDLSWQDTAQTPHVAVVNETFAHKMWGDTPAIGERFILRGHLTEVVGTAEDGKYHDMQESPQAVVYLSLFQEESSDVTVVARSRRAMNEMAAMLERTLSRLEPDAQIRVQSWPDALGGMLFPARAATVSLGIMGLFAAMLAVTGIYGIAAYNVSHRMKELGIRVALGARTKHVISTAVGRPIVLLAAGSLMGLLLGAFASRLLANVVYQANPLDPVVLGGAVFTMALLGILASATPALRAIAVDPSRLMREE
jgi:predicted permease